LPSSFLRRWRYVGGGNDELPSLRDQDFLGLSPVFPEE